MSDSSPNDAIASNTDIDTAASSPADTQADTPNSDSNGSDSSTTKAGSMLDAVQAALAPKEASPASSDPDAAAKAEPDVPKADGEVEEELSDDELKALSWKAQQRFKKLASGMRAKDGEVAALRTKADEYDKIVGSINKAGLDNRDVDELIELGSLLKGSRPDLALAKLKPIVSVLEEIAGEVLPAELQERVRLGYLTEKDARELHKAKTTSTLTARETERLRQQQEAEKEAKATQTLIDTAVEAVETWEKQQAASDPDWPLKRKEVSEQVELLIVREAQKRQKPYFPNAEESVKLSKDALKTVNERYSRFKTRPTEIRPQTPGAPSRSKPAPKTMLDAINNAL